MKSRGGPVTVLRGCAAAALLAACTLAVFLPVRTFGFVVLDDAGLIFDNPHVRHGLTVDGVVWAFRSTQYANWIPLTRLSYLLDAGLFGMEAGAAHLVNLLLHAAASCLILLVLWSMTGALRAALLATALFAIHPLRVESVAWVAERKDVLSGFFLALALAAYLGYVRRRGAGRYALLLVLSAAGLASKPSLVVLPLLLLLLDYWPLGRLPGAGARAGSARPPLRVRGILLEKAPLLLLALLCGLLTVHAQQAGGAVSSFGAVPPLARAANAAGSVTHYLAATFWPAGLSVFYPYPEGSALWGRGAGGLLLIGGVSAVVFRRRRMPFLAVGWLWFLVALAPAIGLVQVGLQARADRYTYLPHLGLFLAGAWAAEAAARGSALRRRVGAAAAAATVLVLMAVARRQVGAWESSETLFRHALAVREDDWFVHDKLGVALFEGGRVQEGLEHLARARQLGPGQPEVAYNRARAMELLGRWEEATAGYREALALDPGDEMSRNNLGVLLAEAGRSAEAEAEFAEGLRRRPAAAALHLNLGRLRRDAGDREGALRHFRAALASDPELREAVLAETQALGAGAAGR